MRITIDELRGLALNLKFDMKEEEYRTLQDEFDVIIRQMELLGEIEGLDNVEPMVFPFDYEATSWREDEPLPTLSVDEVLQNAHDKYANMIKVKKVVG